MKNIVGKAAKEFDNWSESMQKEMDLSGTLFMCGPETTCPDGTPHNDTDYEEGTTLGGARFGSAKCSKCGSLAIDRDTWN